MSIRRLAVLLPSSLRAWRPPAPSRRRRRTRDGPPLRAGHRRDAAEAGPGDWLMWRRTLNGWGYSPLEQIDRSNVATLQAWSGARPMAPGTRKATPLVYDGVMYLPNPATTSRRSTPATGDLLGSTSASCPEGVTGGTNRNIAIWGIDAHRRQRRQPDLRASTRAPASSSGKRRSSIRSCRRARLAGRSSRTARSSPAASASPTPGTTPASSPRTTRDRQGAVARRARFRGPASPATRRWGDVPMEQRWHVGTWMVPSYDPELNLIYVGTSVTIPGAEVHPRRQRQAAPVPQLHARAGRRHRQDRLVLPAPRRSLGSRSSVRAAAGRHRRRAGSDRGRVDQSAPQPGERRKVITGIPGKTGIVYTLDRETGEFLWARADDLAERHQRASTARPAW